ncbi:hypothetical protein D3C81_1848660 [compost metagenome]
MLCRASCLAMASSSSAGGSQAIRCMPASTGVILKNPPSCCCNCSTRACWRAWYSVRRRRMCPRKWPSTMKSAVVACSRVGGLRSITARKVQKGSTRAWGKIT